jgi:succinate dehydrogenase flavin-adding protein (antitoxin of CptAB toxin-antitoxin module)
MNNKKHYIINDLIDNYLDIEDNQKETFKNFLNNLDDEILNVLHSSFYKSNLEFTEMMNEYDEKILELKYKLEYKVRV